MKGIEPLAPENEKDLRNFRVRVRAGSSILTYPALFLTLYVVKIIQWIVNHQDLIRGTTEWFRLLWSSIY